MKKLCSIIISLTFVAGIVNAQTGTKTTVVKKPVNSFYEPNVQGVKARQTVKSTSNLTVSGANNSVKRKASNFNPDQVKTTKPVTKTTAPHHK